MSRAFEKKAVTMSISKFCTILKNKMNVINVSEKKDGNFEDWVDVFASWFRWNYSSFSSLSSYFLLSFTYAHGNTRIEINTHMKKHIEKYVQTRMHPRSYIHTHKFAYEYETIMFYLWMNANNKLWIHCKCSSSNIIDLHLDAVATYWYTW